MKIKILPYFFIIGLWLIFSSPYFLKGLSPFPSNYQVNNFSPWSSYKELSGPVKNAAQPDLITQIYPWKNLVIGQWKKGEIPLWNPYSFSGTPLLANFQSAVLSPFNILFFLPIKFIDSWSLLVLLQPLLAGLFMYIYMKSLKSSSLASLISAISFMFCGFITTWMSYATLGFSVLFIPLGLYTIEKYFENLKTRFLLLLSFTVMLSLFSGHFQASLYAILIIFLYTLFKGLTTKKVKKSFLVILHILFGIMLSMPQLLPTIELYIRSVRSEIFKTGEIIPWTYFATFFAPDFFGNPTTRNDWFGHYAEWNGYTGVISLILASIFLIAKKSKITLFFIFTALISILLSFNTPFVNLLFALKIPVLSTSAASRIIILFSFSIAVLGGLGFDKLSELLTEKPKKVYIWLLSINIFIISIISLIYLFSIPSDKMSIAKSNSLLPFLILFIFSFLIVFLAKIKKKYKYLLFSLLVLISGLDMLRFSTKWQAFDPKDKTFMNVGVSEYYKKNNGIDRFLGLAGGEDGVFYKLPVLTGYDPLYDENYGKFIEFIKYSMFRKPERSVVSFSYKGEHTAKAINFLGVKYVVHKVSDGTFSWAFPFKDYPIDQFRMVYDDGRIQIFENLKAFPRAFVAGNYKVLKNEKEILSQMFDEKTDLSRSVFLSIDPLIPSNKEELKARVKFISYSPNNISLEVDSSDSGILVLTDTYYPGWKVTVNNKRKQIFKADYVFRGVIVPSGKSIVNFYYLPDSFLIGIYLSMIGLLGIIIGPVLESMNKKR